MTSSDVLSLVAIVVALLSLGVTTYEQFLKPARLEVDLGSVVLIAYNGEDRDGINAQLAISLINTGARATIVTKMTATIVQSDGTWRTTLAGHSFHQPIDAGEPGKSMIPWFAFSGYAGPLVAASRNADTTNVFSSARPSRRCSPPASIY